MSFRVAGLLPRPMSRLFPFMLGALPGCDGEGMPSEPAPPRPTTVIVSPSFVTLSSLGDTVSFEARITDQYQAPFLGEVTWTTSDAAVFSVNSAGVVTAVTNGSGTLRASHGGIIGVASVTVQQEPTGVVTIAGGAQMGLPGRALPDSVVVVVVDGGGSPIKGIAVNFTPADGHGMADPAMPMSDSLGLARTSWTLGSPVGTQTLTASVTDAVFTEVRAVAGSIDPPSDTAIYSIAFEATWSATTHPTDFPSGAHFSPLIGAVHAGTVNLWKVGDIASPGIEQMAETGGTSLLRGEIQGRMPAGALSVVSGNGIGSPGSTTIPKVIVNLDYSHITLVTMIAPSPDWFVGISGLSLRDEFGQWLDERKVILYPWDAGTDDGRDYRSGNADSSPKQPIRSLRGVHPFSDQPIGTYTFKRTDAGE